MKSTAMKKAIAEIETTIRESGYSSAHDFHRRSGVGVAYQTVIRMFDPRHETPPSVPTLVEVAYYAGCSPDQIGDILIRIGDRFWHKLIVPGRYTKRNLKMMIIDNCHECNNIAIGEDGDGNRKYVCGVTCLDVADYDADFMSKPGFPDDCPLKDYIVV